MAETLRGLAKLSLTDPKAAARVVLRAVSGWPREILWQAGALCIVLSVLLSEFSALVAPGGRPPGIVGAVLANPLAMAAVQGVILVIAVVALDRIGRMFGGKGSFEGGLALIVWLQALMLAVQLAQLVAFLLLPGLGALIGLASVVLFFWILSNFVTALHGFRSASMVFVGIVVSAFAIMFGVSMLLAFLSLFFPGAPPRV